MIYLLKMRITRVVPLSAALRCRSKGLEAIRKDRIPCKHWICDLTADLPRHSKRRFHHGDSCHRYPDCPRAGCTIRSSAQAVMAIYCDVRIDWMTPPYRKQRLPVREHFHQRLKSGQASAKGRMPLKTDRWYQWQGFPECPSWYKIIIFAQEAKYNDHDSFIRFSSNFSAKAV